MTKDVIPLQPARIHPKADVDPSAQIGRGSVVWANAGILADVVIGEDVSIGRGAEIGRGSKIGKGSRIGWNVFLPPNSVIGEYVFIGPGTTFTDDKYPKVWRSWETGSYTPLPPTVGDGAVVGAAVTVLPGVKIGMGARVAAGSIVTKMVPNYAVVRGGPARFVDLPTNHEWSPFAETVR